MRVEQVCDIVNATSKEILGETALDGSLDNDLIVDIGESVIGSNNMDNYVRNLVDHIGRVVFVDRPYEGNTPSVLMTSTEWGAITEKIKYQSLPEATENESWELHDGESYDPNVFTKPQVAAKFFSKMTTFEIPMSFVQRQIKSAFSGSGQLMAFFAMIENTIAKSLTLKQDSLINKTIGNFIMHASTDLTGNRRVKLVTMYNSATGKSLTSATALLDPDFIKFASMTIKRYAKRMTGLSTLFNSEGNPRNTDAKYLHMILHNDFTASAEAYLQSDTYHDEFVKLPKSEVVPFWQGSGTSFSWSDTATVKGIPVGSDSVVTVNNILGVMFDRDALGVCNLDRRVTSNWNGKGEFTNNWYKFDCGYFNDFGENFVVFTMD
jgi:hypothetical protein